jgi:hypothetical protein
VTPLEMLVVQLRKWDRKGYLKNRPRPDLQNRLHGAAVDRVEFDTGNGKTCVFDSAGLQVLSGTAVEATVAYGDVSGADWMATEIDEKTRMKRTPDFDRLIIERFNGASLVIDGLGQAVFPLLRAFGWIAARNNASRASFLPERRF